MSRPNNTLRKDKLSETSEAVKKAYHNFPSIFLRIYIYYMYPHPSLLTILAHLSDKFPIPQYYRYPQQFYPNIPTTIDKPLYSSLLIPPIMQLIPHIISQLVDPDT